MSMIPSFRSRFDSRFLHNFGRTDQLDREQLVRLCRSIARVCNLIVVDPYVIYTVEAFRMRWGVCMKK